MHCLAVYVMDATLYNERLYLEIVVMQSVLACCKFKIQLCIIIFPFNVCEQSEYRDSSTQSRNHGWSVLAQCSKLSVVLEYFFHQTYLLTWFLL